MSTKPVKEFHETKTFKAIGYTMAGVGCVCLVAQKTKKFVKENMTPIIITGAVAATATIALSMNKLNDMEHSFPEKKEN